MLGNLLEDDGDELRRVAAFLAWEDLEHITRCSRSTRRYLFSPFFREFIARSTVVLPPNSHVSLAILATFPSARVVTIAHSVSLAPSSTPVDGETLLHRVVIDPRRFNLKRSPAIDLSVVAARFPSTKELVIDRLDDINGLQHLHCFPNLRSLVLKSANGRKRDVTWLEESRLLETIDLSAVNIDTIDPLRGLMKLRELRLRPSSQVSSLEPLQHLLKLSVLSIGHIKTTTPREIDRLVKIAPQLATFECSSIASSIYASGAKEDAVRLAHAFLQLETLQITTDSIMDLASFAIITTLRVLSLSTLQTIDLTPLAALRRLEELHITTTGAVDLSPLASLPRLTTLNCWDSSTPSDFETRPAPLHRLETFAGSNHYLSVMGDLERLTQLQVYVWAGDPLMLPIGCATGLRVLQLSGSIHTRELYLRFPCLRDLSLNQCADFEARHLSGLQTLESLTLTSLPHTIDFDQVDLPRLRTLHIYRSSMGSLDGIAGLRNLRQLKITQDGDVDLTPLLQLYKLQVVDLEDTGVRDVAVLASLPSLRKVILPKTADCLALVIAYHASRLGVAATDLREVLHPRTNCVWGVHYSQRVRRELMNRAGATGIADQLDALELML